MLQISLYYTKTRIPITFLPLTLLLGKTLRYTGVQLRHAAEDQQVYSSRRERAAKVLTFTGISKIYRH